MIPQEQLTTAIKIFNELLGKGQVDLNERSDIYDALLDDGVNDILSTIASTSKLTIRKIDKMLYLLPHMDNELYGFSEKEVKERLFSGAAKVDYYLFNYIILVIINKFYSSGGDNPKLLQHLSVNDLIKIVTSSLSGMDIEESRANEDLYSINFRILADRWNGLLTADEVVKGSLKTKRGVLIRVFKFLQEQGLITFHETDDIIKTTRRCDDLMKNFFLSYDRKEEISEFLNRKVGELDASN